jgi:hypothetical protein
MTINDKIELFVLKSASIHHVVSNDASESGDAEHLLEDDSLVRHFVAQFSTEIRNNANRMAEYYKLFYMLENEIRRLIDETLSTEFGNPDWWESYAPQTAKDEYRSNVLREQEAGVTRRSDNPLDYLTFGQLGDIIRTNWSLFGGILSNIKALGRVMYSLNNLRGPIAHCGLLADDEVDRLKLSVKDWFRLMEGPK